MRKYWKKVLSLVCASIIVFSMNINAFARTATDITVTPNTKQQQEIESANEFEVLTMSGNLYSTWIGSGGSSRLDYMGSARSFAWGINVTPISVFPLVFSGSIDIYTASTGSYRGTIPLYGTGPGTTGGVVEIDRISSLRVGVLYKAYFSGTATNSEGQRFHVIDGANIEFIYY